MIACPTCGAWSDVKETRKARRRRQCANGHKFTTYEVTEAEWKQLRLLAQPKPNPDTPVYNLPITTMGD